MENNDFLITLIAKVLPRAEVIWLCGLFFVFLELVMNSCADNNAFENRKFAPVSVVVPVRNREREIVRMLQSVVTQTAKPEQIIIIDNGSEDSTLQTVQQFVQQCKKYPPERFVVLSEPGPGACAARNLGLSCVESEWTMFFDSDDVMYPVHIEHAMQLAHSADIVGWDIEYQRLDGVIDLKPFQTGNMKWLQYSNLFHGTMATQRYMARTAMFRQAGGWNVDVPIWNDIELGCRLLALNPRLRKAYGKPTVRVIASHQSITGSNFSCRAEKYTYALENIDKTLGRHKWILLKSAILAGCMAKEKSSAGEQLYAELLHSVYTAWERLLIRTAYFYTKAGGRGIARILWPLM